MVTFGLKVNTKKLKLFKCFKFEATLKVAIKGTLNVVERVMPH
jgi:hypothetical protein